MKKMVVLMIVSVCLFVSSVRADNMQLGILASGDAVMVDCEYQSAQDFGIIAAGGGFSYASGEYVLGEGLIAFRSDQLLPGLKYGLGFKGVYGEVDDEHGPAEATLSALGFLVEASYELTAAMNPVPVPVEAYGALCFSPSPLSFDETEKYQEYKGGLRFFLLENAFLSLEFKYRRMNFDEPGVGRWKRDDSFLTGGVTLRF